MSSFKSLCFVLSVKILRPCWYVEMLVMVTSDVLVVSEMKLPVTCIMLDPCNIPLFRAGEFWRDNLQPDFNEIEGELSIYIEKFQVIKCAGKPVLLSFEADCLKLR